MTQQYRLAHVLRASRHAITLAAAAFALLATLSPCYAEGTPVAVIVPASFSKEIAHLRLRPAIDATPQLTSELLSAYVARQRQLEAFDAFGVEPEPALTEDVLLGYIARNRNRALKAIEDAEIGLRPALTADVLSDYAASKFVPTGKKVERAADETLCLTQAIYHEARGESEDGQRAVANIVINRAMSRKYPSTICGVVYQNADQGRYRCQFTFACDGRSDMGKESKAWSRAARLAEAAFRKFQQGKSLEVLPSSALYYHTTAVAPSWSHTYRRVAAIGAHIFYAPN